MMWSWLGGQAAQKRKEAPKNAILTLRAQLDMLQKREKHLETQMDEHDAVARKFISTNKTGASFVVSIVPCKIRNKTSFLEQFPSL
jgi:charged multivesicular body protein 4